MTDYKKETHHNQNSFLNFEILLTEDGSPSLILENDSSIKEAMHSTKGAFSESLYIYLWTMEQVVSKKFPLYFFSLGLGLGYNEMILISYLKFKNQNLNDLILVSSEKHEYLINSFKNWALNYSGQTANKLIPSYEKILNYCSRQFQLAPIEIKEALSSLIQSNKFIFTSEIDPQFNSFKKINYKYSGIFYDAFSEKYDSTLWSEEFLSQFIKIFANSHCALSSYAAKGSLKRALIKNGFQIKKQPGFRGKREATFSLKTYTNPV